MLSPHFIVVKDILHFIVGKGTGIIISLQEGGEHRNSIHC